LKIKIVKYWQLQEGSSWSLEVLTAYENPTKSKEIG